MLEAGQAVGSYRVVRKIGEGAMGAVFEAVHEHIQRRVALKVLRPQFSADPGIAARFINEARAVNIIDHPGLVVVSDYGTLPDGAPYIVMEYLRGESLASRMRRVAMDPDGPQVARQIALALAAAHEKGIIHRDLKPGNVMLVPDHSLPGGVRAKVLDFGIAKLAASRPEGSVETATGMLMGTPAYIAPEQCREAAHVTDRADVYALGVMLYEMLAGRRPFTGSEAEILAGHLHMRPPPLRELAPGAPPALAELAHAMLDKDPAARPSMVQVAAALQEALPTHPPASGQSPRPSTLAQAAGSLLTRAPGGRGPVLIVAPLVVALACVGLWRLNAHHGHQPVPPPPPRPAPPAPVVDPPKLGLQALQRFHDASGSARNLLREADPWDAAAADFARALAAPGSAAPARWRAGRAFCAGEARLARGDLPGATQEFRAAVAAEDGWAAPHLGLAAALTKGGDVAGGLAQARRAEELEPGWWVPVSSIAAINAQAGQNDAAIQAYRRALALAPNQVALQDGLAMALHRAHLDMEASDLADRALQQDPDLVWSRLVRAQLALDRGDGKTALAEAERAASVSPRTAAVQLARADALALLRRRDEALGVYRDLLALIGDTPGMGLPADRIAGIRKAVAQHSLPPPPRRSHR